MLFKLLCGLLRFNSASASKALTLCYRTLPTDPDFDCVRAPLQSLRMGLILSSFKFDVSSNFDIDGKCLLFAVTEEAAQVFGATWVA